MIDIAAEPSRRVVQHRFGDPRSVLQVEEAVPAPSFSQGEVRIRVSSNVRPDWLQYSSFAPVSLMLTVSTDSISAARCMRQRVR